MCGIFGFYDPAGITRERVQECLAALQLIRHRGPDGEGVLLLNSRTGASATLHTPDTPAGVTCNLHPGELQDGQYDLLLGHRRLSIIDVSVAGHQPMRDEAGNFVVFNGEIYNYIELRDELSALGTQFSTHSDTEVLMAAWRKWGTGAFNRFNGMWAMVMWDAKTRKLLLTTDRFGVKPLYISEFGEGFAFSSEIKAFHALRGWSRDLEPQAIDYFLATGVTEPEGKTFYKSVKRFPPSHYSFSSPGQSPLSAVSAYWKRDVVPTQLSYEQACDRFRDLLSSAVQLRMRSDVDWGTSLSGGLDSSAIVYTASDLTRNVLRTGQGVMCFSAVFRGREGDESPFVDRIVKDLDLRAHYTDPMQLFSPDEFKRHVYHQDYPVDSTSYYAERCVMKLASEAGVKVVLDGQGSDELFAGYHHHFYKYLRQLWLGAKCGLYKKELEAFAQLKGLDPARVKSAVKADLKGWLRHAFGSLSTPQDKWNYSRDTSTVMDLDFFELMLPMYLRTEDRSSMMVSVETRQPFLDYRLVEFARSLPLSYKMRNGWQKAVVRDALPLLPDEIRYRKDKKGYTTPEVEWMRQFEDFFVEAVGNAKKVSPAGGMSADEAREAIRKGNTPMILRHATLGIWEGVQNKPI